MELFIAVPNPNPNGHGESLLAAMEGGPSQIVRLDPGEPYRATVELDVREFLNREWGTVPRYFIVANNHMTWVGETSARALLISLQIHRPHKPKSKQQDRRHIRSIFTGSFARHTRQGPAKHRRPLPS